MATEPASMPAPAVYVRGQTYQFYIVGFMGLVALMDNYLSGVENSAIPYILAEYNTTAADFAALKARFLVVTFFVFALNALNDLVGRRPAILALILLMGLSALAIVFFTPTLLLFMTFYALAIFATVSNMWAIVVGEESPASRRARYTAVVFVISLAPIQAFAPVLLVQKLGLDWRWMYGVVFIVMIPVLGLWLFMKETGRYHEVQAVRSEEQRRRTWRTLTGLDRLEKADRRYIVLATMIVMGVLVTMTLAFWAGYFFMQVHGYTLAQWSTVLFGLLVLEILGALSGGWLMDRVGRNRLFVAGGLGLSLTLGSLAFLPAPLLPVAYASAGFFIGVISTWLYVYLPEIFPTDRRGTCLGWVTSLSRVSYVAGPALAGVLLRSFPTMAGFWIAAGLVALIPTAIVLLARPFETRALELETIATQR